MSQSQEDVGGVTMEMRQNARKYWKDFNRKQSAKKMHQQHMLYCNQAAAYIASMNQQPHMSSPPSPENAYGYDPYHHHCQHEPWRTDLYVALDCEMVGVGHDGKTSQLARVTIVDWNGKCLMDEFVIPTWVITDYRTFVSGITPQKLRKRARMDFHQVRQLVLHYIEGKILVGHDLRNDLEVLEINPPWWMVRDTAWYRPYMKTRGRGGGGCCHYDDDGCLTTTEQQQLWPRGLKELAGEKLGRIIQKRGRPHCPHEDAKAALDLYKLCWKQWEQSVQQKAQADVVATEVAMNPKYYYLSGIFATVPSTTTNLVGGKKKRRGRGGKPISSP